MGDPEDGVFKSALAVMRSGGGRKNNGGNGNSNNSNRESAGEALGLLAGGNRLRGVCFLMTLTAAL